MTKTIKTTALLVFLTTIQFAFSQDNKAKAHEKGVAAVKLEDEGKYQEAIKIWEEAEKLDPENGEYPYEIGLCYNRLKEYEKVIKIVEKLTSRKDAEDVVYQLLGNAYDNLGKQDKAIQTYKEGLVKFPNSGPLYLESGIVQMSNKDYNKALSYFEKGIEVAPQFPSNYYWSAIIYCSSSEEVWGMIYGELFMNLERNSKRTAEISKLLYDTYKSEIKFTSDTSYSVSFSKDATMNVADLKAPDKIKLAYGVGVYEPTIALSIISVKTIDLNTLDKVRSNFVDRYFENGNNKTYPNVLFSFQKQLKEAGYMEAYNHWVLMKGDPDGFKSWMGSNKDKWDAFIKWFGDNGLKLNESNKFYRGQY